MKKRNGYPGLGAQFSKKNITKENEMEKKWKFMVWAVILLFLLVPFATSAEGKQAAAEAMEITWMMRVKSGEETTWFIQELEDKFNVTILPNGIAKDDREKA